MEVSVDAKAGRMGIVDNPTPRGRMRAADSDRERVAEQLRVAHADGRLDLTEYDERVQQAWAARTYGELDVLTADLPGLPRSRQRLSRRHATGRTNRSDTTGPVVRRSGPGPARACSTWRSGRSCR